MTKFVSIMNRKSLYLRDSVFFNRTSNAGKKMRKQLAEF